MTDPVGSPESPSRIALLGPDPNPENSAYGGGKGGILRQAEVLYQTFRADRIELFNSYVSVRQTGKLFILTLPKRLLYDLANAVRTARVADGLHLLFTYRQAIVREFFTVFICSMMRRPVMVDIRAGSFIPWYESCNPVYRWMVRYCLRKAGVVAAEGRRYIDYLHQELGLDQVIYHPTFVPLADIPEQPPERLGGDGIRVVFAGFCYEPKGVKELVLGCGKAASEGLPIDLVMVGHEEPTFATWLDEQDFEGIDLTVHRLGVQEHGSVLAELDRADVFGFPTRHPGEGHPSVINEAMLLGLAIVCTRHGFLESILDEESCYFVEKNDPESVAAALREIGADREAARRKAHCGYQKLRSCYTEEQVVPAIEAGYHRLLSS